MSQSIESISSKNLICIEIDEPLIRALTTMRDNRIRHLPVVDGGKLIGIISDRDIQRAMRSEILKFDSVKVVDLKMDPSLKVRDFVSWPVKVVESTASIQEVNQKMIQDKVSAFVITDGDKVRGIVTHEDLLMYLDSILSSQDRSIGIWDRLKLLTAKSPIGTLVQELSSSGV
jgi:acetoin utilization protein AcuB